MSTTIDDLSAVRIIYDALIQLDEPTRERVLRWVNEKLGTARSAATDIRGTKAVPLDNGFKRSVGRPKSVKPISIGNAPESEDTSAQVNNSSEGLSKFLAIVMPKTANQIIAATARYFKQAPGTEKRPSIDSSDVEAAYIAMSKNVPNYIGQLLITAKNMGYVKNMERGKYALTVLGEEMLSEVSAGRSDSTLAPV